MPPLNGYEKVTCENCGTQTTKLKLARHKKTCSVRTLYCTQCPYFSTTSGWLELSYCQKTCNTSCQKYTQVYFLFERVLWPLCAATTQNKRAWKPDEISWIWREKSLWRWRRKPQRITPSLSTFPRWLWDWKRKTSCFQLPHVNLGLPKLTSRLDLFSKNVEDRLCRNFYAHENTTVMERWKLLCTPDDLDNLEEKLQKMDISDLCTQERANT